MRRRRGVLRRRAAARSIIVAGAVHLRDAPPHRERGLAPRLHEGRHGPRARGALGRRRCAHAVERAAARARAQDKFEDGTVAPRNRGLWSRGRLPRPLWTFRRWRGGQGAVMSSARGVAPRPLDVPGRRGDLGGRRATSAARPQQKHRAMTRAGPRGEPVRRGGPRGRGPLRRRHRGSARAMRCGAVSSTDPMLATALVSPRGEH